MMAIPTSLWVDVKLGENFRRNASYFSVGSNTGAPASVTYSTVV